MHGCPRCRRGDISVDKDQYGWYEYCLQCGYVRDLVDIDKVLPGHPVYLKKGRYGAKITEKRH
jgi:hypothetical protein